MKQGTSNFRVAVASRSFSKNPTLRAELLERYPNVTFNETGKVLSGEELIAFLSDHDLAITGLETINEAILKRLPKLKSISKYGVGLDMLNLQDMEKYGVQLGWTGGVNRLGVAELALTFALLLVRGTYVSHRHLRDQKWVQSPGRQLSGKTIGIIGCGHVGKELVRLLQPFQCRILVNDIRDYPEFFNEQKIRRVTLEELLKESDGITIHTPLDPSTQNLLSAEKLQFMKSGAFLINTARGGIVDESALKALLKSGQISGAAFDVFGVEPPTDLELLNLPNFFGTPHIGGSSAEAVIAMGRSAIENLSQGRSALSFA